MAEYMIETWNLTKRFADLTAVNKINIRVRKGTIHGFIGPNGAGKTTTMKMLIGALRPNSGKGFIKGETIGSIAARKLIGYSPEQPSFYGEMTGFDYLVYIGRICGVGKKDCESRAIELLNWLGLGNFANKRIKGFSAGMKQKLSLAQAMIHEPELLILDEPTANLDPEGRAEIIRKLRELCRKKHITVFISSHILSELEKMIDYVTMIREGKIVTEGEVGKLEKEISGRQYVLKTSDDKRVLTVLKSRKLITKGWIDERDTLHVVVKGDEERFKKRVTSAISRSGAGLDFFSPETRDLEAVFMKMIGERKIEEKGPGFLGRLRGRIKRRG